MTSSQYLRLNVRPTANGKAQIRIVGHGNMATAYSLGIASEPLELPFNPQEVLRTGVVMRDRRRSRTTVPTSGIWDSLQLRDWATKSGSSFLYVHDTRLRSEEPRDLAMDLIQGLQRARVNVIWYLAPFTSQQITATDIIRSFIHQMIQQLENACIDWKSDLNTQEVHESRSEYLKLLVSVISHVQKVVVIIDMRNANPAISETIDEFWRMAEQQGMTTVVKFLMLTDGLGDESPQIKQPKHLTSSIGLQSIQHSRSSLSSSRSKVHQGRTGRNQQETSIIGLALILQQLS